MPGLISRQDISNAAVSPQPRLFSKFGGKMRTARVHFKFVTADLPVSMPHSLGRTPNSFRVVTLSRDGAPGQVYTPLSFETPWVDNTQTDSIYCFGRNYIVLACTTGATWAELEIS